MRKTPTTRERRVKGAPPTPRTRASRAVDSPEKTTQRSVSLRPSQWERLDVLGDLTQWGRSGAVSQAVDLVLSLPVQVVQRLVTLKQTTARTVLERRLVAAVEDAIAVAEAELPDTQWAEFDAALAAIGKEFARSGVAAMSEQELIDAAEAGKQAYRADRRGSRG